MKNPITSFLFIVLVLFAASCKEKVAEKPFMFNGESLETIVRNAISEDENSKNILNGLITFNAELKTFNKIDVDSIEINNNYYYTLLLANQNPVYNLFAVVDKDMNLILKDESLNGYLNLNFKKSGSRRFAVITENFNSKDVVELNRISYYSLEQHSSDLVFRQFIKIKTPVKKAEQVISVISDTAIITSIFYPDIKSSKISKDVFRFDVASSRYLSVNNLFDTVVVKEIRSLNIQIKNPQITDGESILRFFNDKQNGTDLSSVKLTVNDFVIELDSTWKRLGNIAVSNLVKQKISGLKYINGKIGASISLAAIAPTDSAENYFNEPLINNNQFASSVRFSEKLIDSKNIYQLFEFFCPTKKILMILETPKSTYELNKNNYEQIIKTFQIKC